MFAIKVPVRSLGKISPNPYRVRVPATPPIDTRAKEFMEFYVTWN
jgi:hypothetical protein